MKRLCAIVLSLIFLFSFYLPTNIAKAAEVDNAVVVSEISTDGVLRFGLKTSESITNVKGIQFKIELPEQYTPNSFTSSLSDGWVVDSTYDFSMFLIYNSSAKTIEQTEVSENGIYPLFDLNCSVNEDVISGDMLDISINVVDISTGNNISNLGVEATTNSFVFVDSAFIEDDYTYTLTENGAEITRYIGSSTETVIPSSVGEYTVTSIKNDAFSLNTSVQSVEIPETVVAIGETAFQGCNDLTIRGYENSYAKTYANDNSIPFELITYKVQFLGANNKVLYELTVNPGEVLDTYKSIIDEIVAPEIYGYEAYTIDGVQAWNDNIYSGLPIYFDCFYTAKYIRKQNINTEILVYSVNNDILINTTLPYDALITTIDEAANSWLMQGNVVGIGNTLQLYACGTQMVVNASDEVVNEISKVSIVGTVLEDNKFFVFAHAESENITEYGVMFTNNTFGSTLNEETFTYENISEAITRNEAIITNSTQNNSSSKLDFVGPLNIKVGVTRYARAYIKVGATYYYSSIVSVTN